MNSIPPKKNILIAYGNPYMLHSLLMPFIKEAGECFNVFVITTNYYLPSGLVRQLEAYREERIIVNYLIAPVYRFNNSEDRSGFRMHFYMRAHLGLLRQQEFDLCIMNGSSEVWQRYIIDCALSKSCIRVGLFSPGFALGMHQKSVTRFIRGEDAKEILIGLTSPWDDQRRSDLEKLSVIRTKLQSAVLRKRILKRSWRKILRFFSGNFVMRYVYPLCLVQRCFQVEVLDSPTWFDTARFHKIVAFQRFSQLFLMALYGKEKCYLVKYPLPRNCFCDDLDSNRSSLLVCLRGVESAEHYSSLCRDIKNIASELSLKYIHIRPHPRSSLDQFKGLIANLNQSGFGAEIRQPLEPLREIVCNYRGVIGTPSTALLEARMSCGNCFVAGLLGGLKMYSESPKYILGDVRGYGPVIDWVEQDGSYDSDAIHRKHQNDNQSPSLIELIGSFLK